MFATLRTSFSTNWAQLPSNAHQVPGQPPTLGWEAAHACDGRPFPHCRHLHSSAFHLSVPIQQYPADCEKGLLDAWVLILHGAQKGR